MGFRPLRRPPCSGRVPCLRPSLQRAGRGALHPLLGPPPTGAPRAAAPHNPPRVPESAAGSGQPSPAAGSAVLLGWQMPTVAECHRPGDDSLTWRSAHTPVTGAVCPEGRYQTGVWGVPAVLGPSCTAAIMRWAVWRGRGLSRTGLDLGWGGGGGASPPSPAPLSPSSSYLDCGNSLLSAYPPNVAVLRPEGSPTLPREPVQGRLPTARETQKTLTALPEAQPRFQTLLPPPRHLPHQRLGSPGPRPSFPSRRSPNPTSPQG